MALEHAGRRSSSAGRGGLEPAGILKEPKVRKAESKIVAGT